MRALLAATAGSCAAQESAAAAVEMKAKCVVSLLIVASNSPTRHAVAEENTCSTTGENFPRDGYAKEWAELALPWPAWAPCNRTKAYEVSCTPQETKCIEERSEYFSSHGIGNALMVKYTKVAKEIFATGCAPVLHDTVAPSQQRNFGRPEDGSLFVLQKYVQVPERIPASLTTSCVTYAITQPREAVAAAIASAQVESDAAAPQVALHVRTGWSDATAFHGKKIDASQAWNDLDCSAYADAYFNITGDVIRDKAGNTLRSIVLNTAAAADAAFGAQQWQLFVASDAPAVKRYVRQLLNGRALGQVMTTAGQIGALAPAARVDLAKYAGVRCRP